MFGNAGTPSISPPAADGCQRWDRPARRWRRPVFRAPSSMQVTGSAPGVITGTVDVYANHACGPLDHEAEVWLGRVPVANGAFIGTVNAPLFLGSQVTATVTDGAGNTSEVSNCLPSTRVRSASRPACPRPRRPRRSRRCSPHAVVGAASGQGPVRRRRASRHSTTLWFIGTRSRRYWRWVCWTAVSACP